MVDAPEKLWMTAEEMGWPGSFRSFRMSDLEHPEDEYPAYVRADLYEQVKRELAYQEKVSSDRFERIERQAYAYDEMCIRTEAAERLAGARVKVKLLEWSEIRPPNEEVRYDHVVSASALGQWSIEWKSWKDYDDRTIFLDGDFVANGGENLEAAKAAAQADYERRIISALAEPAGEAEPMAWATVRVEDTPDGLLIHPDDAKEWGLLDDHPYEGTFLPDGRYRIALTTPPDASSIRAALRAGWEYGRKSWCPAFVLEDEERTERDWAKAYAALAGRAER